MRPVNKFCIIALMVAAIAMAGCGGGNGAVKATASSGPIAGPKVGTPLTWPSATISTVVADESSSQHVSQDEAYATVQGEDWGLKGEGSQVAGMSPEASYVQVDASGVAALKPGDYVWLFVFHNVKQEVFGSSPASGSAAAKSTIPGEVADYVVVADARDGHGIFAFSAVPG